MIDPQFYDSQATLDQSRPCYIERQADHELLAAVLEGTYPLLLSSRKMGKSSLIERVFVSLRKQPESFLVARKELTLVNKDVTADQWCYGIARDLAQDAQTRCGFTVDPAWKDWWAAEARLAPIERFFAFIREFLLYHSESRWVIAIDEIETTIALSFSDDFFAALRSCVTGQAGDRVLRRLTFILAGVTTPSQLIKEASRTPFNIGRVISIRDFSTKQAAQLLPGLGIEPDESSLALQAVLYWTDGHPYLTQRLFKDLAVALQEQGIEDESEVTQWQSEVNRLVEQRYLRPGVRVTEEHFRDIAERRLEECRKQGIADAFLRRYRRALRGEKLRDEPLSQAMTQLKLSGLVKPAEDGTLIARNLLYRRVFDEAWVKDEMPVNAWRRLAMVASSALVVAIALWFFWLSPMLAMRATREAEIFSAVRAIAFANSEIPANEREQLERYTNEEIARSIHKGKDRFAEIGLTPDQYQRLLKYADRPQIASELWSDYWLRQTDTLQRLATTLVSSSGSRLEIDKATAELIDTADRLQHGLSEGDQVVTQIHAVANKAMTSAVERLWEPANLIIPAKPSQAEIERLATSASDIGAKWDALAQTVRALAPLVDDDTMQDDFALLVHGPPNQRQNMKRAEAKIEKAIDDLPVELTDASRNRLQGEVRNWDHERSRAHRTSLQGMVHGANNSVAHALGLTLCEALEQPQASESYLLYEFGSALASLAPRMKVADATALAQRLVVALENPPLEESRHLAELASALGALATRLDARDASPLVSRGAVVLIRALENSQNTSDLSIVGSALELLASSMNAAEVRPLTRRLIAALENPQLREADRLSELARALATLTTRLDDEEVAPLAARGVEVLVKALEDPQLTRHLVSSFARALASLSARMKATDAAPLASRLTTLLENPQESDSNRLTELGLALDSLSARMNAPEIKLLAERLATALESQQSEGANRLSELGTVLASLVKRLDPNNATPLAARGAKVLDKAFENAPESELPKLGNALASLVARLDTKDAAPIASRWAAVLVKSMEGLEDSSRLPELGEAFAKLSTCLDAKVASPLVARGAAVLVNALENHQESDFLSLSRFGRALSSLASRINAAEATLLAERLVTAMENGPPRRFELLTARCSSLASLLERLDTRHARLLASRGAAVLAKALENPQQVNSFDLSELGTILSRLVVHLDAKDAGALVARPAEALVKTIQSSPESSIDAGISLVALAAHLEQKKAEALTETAAFRLMQLTTAKSIQDRRGAAAVISILAIWMEPAQASAIAARCVTVLTQSDTNSVPPSADSIAYGLPAASMAVRLPSKESAQFAERVAMLITFDSGQLSEFPRFLKYLRESLGPKAYEMLIQDWINAVAKLQQSVPTEREKLGEVREALRKELSEQR